MKLEHQVCSLESAKRLKELGVRQESLWFWQENWDSDNPEGKHWWCLSQHGEGMGKELFSAFTVAELGELLPDFLYIDNEWWQVLCYQERKVWYCEIMDRPTWQFAKKSVEEQFEAEARAKMLTHLYENKLISVKNSELHATH